MNEPVTSRNVGLAIGGVAPVVVAGALVAVRDTIADTNVALVLVLVILLAAMTGGWPAGVVSAVLATLSYDFFHTQPYLSLNIASGDEVETVLLLLVVGVTVGLLAGRARTARADARMGVEELIRIHRIAELVAHGRPPADILMVAQRELAALLGLHDCRFEGPPFRFALARIEQSGAVTGAGEMRLSGRYFELPREGVELPAFVCGQEIGRFILEPTPGRGVSLQERIVAVAIADQVGAALAVSTPNPRGLRPLSAPSNAVRGPDEAGECSTR